MFVIVCIVALGLIYNTVLGFVLAVYRGIYIIPVIVSLML